MPPNGAARLLDASKGRDQRPRTSSYSRGLLRTPPARAARRRKRSGDNSTRIDRTTAKRHSKAALKARSSSPDASSWLLSPRDDASRSSRAAALRPKHPYKRTTEGGRLRMHRKRCDRYDHPMSWSSARALQVDHALPDKRAPDAAHRTTAAQNSIDSTATTHSQYLSNREQKTPQKRLLTALSNRTTS